MTVMGGGPARATDSSPTRACGAPASPRRHVRRQRSTRLRRPPARVEKRNCPPGSYDCRDGCHSVTHPVVCPPRVHKQVPGLARPTPSVPGRRWSPGPVLPRQSNAASAALLCHGQRLLLRSPMDAVSFYDLIGSWGISRLPWGLDPARRPFSRALAGGASRRRVLLGVLGGVGGRLLGVLGRPRCNAGRCSAPGPTS